MKHLLFIFLFLKFFILQSQNWLPIDTSKTYHYSISNDSVIYRTITSKQNQDTTFFETIIDSCSTCSNSSVFYFNQPSFLNFYMINDFDTSFTFLGKDTFTIKTNKSIGSTWMYKNNKTAQVVNESEMLINGSLDSIKTIWLEGIDTLIISKSNGIIQFVDFNKNQQLYQVGIENIGGTQNLTALDIFDFNVGDIFQYKGQESGYAISYTTWQKIKILEYNIVNDTIVYKVKSTTKHNGYNNIYPYPNNYATYIDSNTYTERVYIYDSIINSTAKFNYEWNNTLYETTYGLNDSLVEKIIKPISQSYYVDSGFYDNIYNFDEQNFTNKYAKGLGGIYYEMSMIDNYSSRRLIGYYKGTDTIGTIYNDDFYTVGIKEEVSIDEFLKFYPNPNKGILQIDLKENQKIDFKIIDNIGKPIFYKELKESQKLNISSLLNGIYIIEACNNDGKCGYSKLIINK